MSSQQRQTPGTTSCNPLKTANNKGGTEILTVGAIPPSCHSRLSASTARKGAYDEKQASGPMCHRIKSAHKHSDKCEVKYKMLLYQSMGEALSKY